MLKLVIITFPKHILPIAPTTTALPKKGPVGCCWSGVPKMTGGVMLATTVITHKAKTPTLAI